MIYYWFLLGVIVGSFLNVCIYRLPRGESLLFPSSHCPLCSAKLKALDLIPLVGYFLLRGRCRYCGGRIPWRYPLVELLSGLVFALAWQRNAGNYFEFFFQLFFACLLIVISGIDLEWQVIPDAVSLTGIFSGLAYNTIALLFLKSPSRLIASLSGMVLGYVILWLIGKVGEIFFKKEAMGEGDWLLAAMLGAYLGWEGVVLSIFLAFFLAAFLCLILMPLRRVKFGQPIPFAPALATAALISLFWGETILNWYFNLYL